MAHAVLGAAVAAAGGNDALTAGIAAGGAEAAAPVLAKWLYNKDAKDLTAAEKNTIGSIGSLAGAAVGAGSGSVADIVARSQGAKNAVENNYLTAKEVDQLVDFERACKQGDQQACANRDKLQLRDMERDIRLLQACRQPSSSECMKLRREADIANAGLKSTYFDQIFTLDKGKVAAHRKEFSETDAVLLLSHGWTPEEIAREAHLLNTARNLLADVTFVGTIKAFKEADTLADYAVATIFALPGLKQADAIKHAGDFTRAYKSAKKAGDIKAAKEVIELARTAEKSPNNLAKLAQKEAEIQAKKTIKNLKIDKKVSDQMSGRGWSKQEIENVIKKGPTGASVDKRSPAKTPDGLGRNDSADVYGDAKNHVVINRRTGEVTQVSDRYDRDWKTDGRIKFFK